jgi:putative Mg2+ transporter-C (MgtC) family protein
MREQGHITGLTTAATLWATAAVGLAIAFGMYILGVLTALIVFALLAVHHLPGWRRLRKDDDHEDVSNNGDGNV